MRRRAVSRRRRALLLLAALGGARAAWGQVRYPDVLRGRALRFPRDHGAHPEFRTEWWYVTGQARDARNREFGIQITFFRNRPGLQEDNPSRFAPKQLLFAHAAVAEPAHGRLRHDQRAARAGFGLAEASIETTAVRIDDWTLALEGDRYRATIRSNGFELDLTFAAMQAPVLQGENGVSRKGPRSQQASYYYSRPQLATTGSIDLGSERVAVQGLAWLDHEWSSTYLAPEAAGWDWIGLNLDDGGAVMAFRIRRRDGGVLWSGGSIRDARGSMRTLGPDEVGFESVREWRSPRTGIAYPVAMRVRVRELSFDLDPLMDDQELDARASVGTIYWEGAVRVHALGRLLGRGYLELTGYGQPLRL